MSTPYSNNLSWNNSIIYPSFFVSQNKQSVEENQSKRAINDIVDQVFKQSVKRGVQFIRDAARLILKTPIRCVYKPFLEKCIWRQSERAGLNGKLVGYSFVQFASVPAKFLVALIALSISPFSTRNIKWLQDKSQNWTQNIDARQSKLEALKEEGLKNAKSKTEFFKYKQWIETISPELCRET